MVSEELSEHSHQPQRSAQLSLYGVYEISKLLTSPARLEVLLSSVVNLLSSFLDMRHGLIALLGPDGEPELLVGANCTDAMAQRYFEELPEQATGRIVVTQMPLVVENVREDALFAGSQWADWTNEEVDVTFIGVPIKDRGRVVGTLSIDRERPRGSPRTFRFDDDVRFLTMVANLLGQTVRLQRFVANDRERLLEEQRRLEKAFNHSHDPGALEPPSPPGGIVGMSPAIRAVLEKVRLVALSHSTVLLRGESGTGKELFARALHELSPRKSQPFITLNCAALPESVLESELFGHEKGAFTGAASMRKGRFELADTGTLFLDEIGEISPTFQAKLLRVLQLGEFERVGGVTTQRVDVRIVAATNRNLERAVAEGQFRADLYYRISVVPILLPPLRERPSDIPLLARAFLERFNRENGTCLALSEQAIGVLTACSFPGNVRELENCVRRTATLAPGTRIAAGDFACRHDECLSSVLWKHTSEGTSSGFVPLPITKAASKVRAASGPIRPSAWPAAGYTGFDDDDSPPDFDDAQAKGERERLIEAMESVGWVQAKAARVLGLTPRQVGYALRKYDIEIKKF